MRRLEVAAGAVWVAFALAVAVEAFQLGLGMWRRPGPGFLPLGAALVLALGGLVVIGHAVADRASVVDRSSWPGPAGRRRGVVVLAALLVYALILERIGFVLATFLLLCVLLRGVEGKSWPFAVGFAAATALVTAVVFGVWLKAPLPVGILTLPGF